MHGRPVAIRQLLTVDALRVRSMKPQKNAHQTAVDINESPPQLQYSPVLPNVNSLFMASVVLAGIPSQTIGSRLQPSKPFLATRDDPQPMHSSTHPLTSDHIYSTNNYELRRFPPPNSDLNFWCFALTFSNSRRRFNVWSKKILGCTSCQMVPQHCRLAYTDMTFLSMWT